MSHPIFLRAVICTALSTSAYLIGCSSHAEDVPAFPSAQGYGAKATGGRGGRVIKVTTLASDGPGSLQAALDVDAPRIIVFDVSGVITGDVVVRHGDVTIAGQTAPGAGITIAGRLLGAYDDTVGNIIIRHVRVRPIYDGSHGELFDAIQLSRNRLIMLDHISASWGVDETIDLYEAHDVTVQFSTIGESATTGHPEGAHNYGLISGPDGHRISVHHNFFAHHQNRVPAIANGPADVRNNLAYDVRHGFVHHNPASGQFNIVGNSYIRGPSDMLIPFFFDDESEGDASLSYHLANNWIDDPGNYVGFIDNPWTLPPAHPSFEDLYLGGSFYAPSAHVFTEPGYVPITTQSAQEGADIVANEAGAFPRDVVTLRMFSEMASRSGSWGATVPADLLAGLTPTSPPPDADGDGMADAWESANGLDPDDGDDHDEVLATGYTAIETYINELADNLIRPPNGSTPPKGDDPAGQNDEGPSSGIGDENGTGAPRPTAHTAPTVATAPQGCSAAGSRTPISAFWAALGLALVALKRRR